MTPSDAAASWLFPAGLDTTVGSEFVQRRVALFAKILAGISAAFLLAGVIIGVTLGLPLEMFLTGTMNIAHIGGLVLLVTVWLLCRRRRKLTLPLLGVVDALAVIGSCTAWAFFIRAGLSESVYSAVVSVTMTLLAHAIVVPAKAVRTLCLSIVASVPTVVSMLLWVQHSGVLPSPYTPWMTLIFQSLLLTATITMATITSRILYDLRRSVQEANELGQYALEEKLGGGGMGEVWRARHRFLVREAAVKLIRPELLVSENGDPDVVLRRFEREALATAQLHSPHTVQLYDFGQADDGTLFYVMELLEGINLEDLVRRFGPIPAERAVHILEQVCHSLDEAHRNGLTHRDIKPANILITAAGTELDFVKVLDFGLVRFQSAQPAAGDGLKLTAEGSMAGTPAYTAPEIAEGAPYDHRVDLYSVGCVGYWLLTGTLVFDRDTMMKILIDHARTPPPLPRTRTELPIPPDVEQVIMQCLEKDPEKRPANAGELLDRLLACELPQAWTRARADAWWQLHMPKPANERPASEVLLAHEGGTPARARPRRPLRVRGSTPIS